MKRSISSPAQVSLAAMVALTKGLAQKGSSTDVSPLSHPTLQDLAESLKFSPGDGRIWMHDQRMILMHSSSLAELRRELVESLGHEQARGILTRIGYASGSRDAVFVRQNWPDSEPAEAFAAGPRLHSVEGVVKVEPVRFEFDAAKGQFYGEFLWHHSVEDDEQISRFGIGHESACWMQIGYASGFASAFLGRLIVYREVECRSSGAALCRIIGKPVDEWDTPETEIRYLSAETFSNAMRIPPKEKANGVDRALIGVSPAYNAATHMIRRVAPTQATVLFTGESGVGKEMFARQLHQISSRAERAFIGVNCAAIPEALIEAELFGVEKGAFTGAVTSRPGRFERASGGTLFLDEIGSLSVVAQGKLLRALQEKEIERVGGVNIVKVDVRVIAATNVNLKEAVRRGEFREDLFYRLNVFPIHLPPLRDRREDIPLLTDYFLHKYSTVHGRSISGIAHSAASALSAYTFPGNVRELENMIERAVILAPERGIVENFHLFAGENPVAVLGSTSENPVRERPDDRELLTLEQTLQEPVTHAIDQLMLAFDQGVSLDSFNRALYQRVIRANEGNLAKAARLLGISRAKLAYRSRGATSP